MLPALTTSRALAFGLCAVALAVAYAGPRLQDGGNGTAAGSGATTSQPGMGFPGLGGGGTADSNGRMIAVTGVDLTGSSVLYLVDTVTGQLCVYQASGGSKSSQGVRLLGARNISLDLKLDGFNDRTESEGRPLGYKDLERMFRDQGLPLDD
jgi:hypothetical protein